MARSIVRLLEEHAAESFEAGARYEYARLAILACRIHPVIALENYRASGESNIAEAFYLLEALQRNDVPYRPEITSDRGLVAVLADYKKFGHILRCLGFFEESNLYEKALRAACKRFTSSRKTR
jgi:hypothetical protein